MGMKGNADDYEKGIDHSVSINSGAAWLRMRKNQENRKRGRLIPCLLFRTIHDVRPKCRAVEWHLEYCYCNVYETWRITMIRPEKSYLNLLFWVVIQCRCHWMGFQTAQRCPISWWRKNECGDRQEILVAGHCPLIKTLLISGTVWIPSGVTEI